MLGTAKYGMAQPLSLTAEPVAPAASAGAVATGAVLGNPALWAVGIAAVMLGLIGVSTSGRIGPLRASISAGKA